MEETDMCHLTATLRSLQQAIPNGCPAKALAPSDRLTLGVQALAGTRPITRLAGEYDVSRKFVYQQRSTAHTALQEAFASAEVADDQVLFQLPVTKAWLRQATLGLTLICHSSVRGVQEFLRDLVDVPMAIGTVHNILQDAVAKARPHNLRPSLGHIDIAALDEIFQNRRPVLVGADVASTYCFLLSLEDHRDADTWGVRLLELQERGLAPRATIADFGTSLRAGQELAFPGLPAAVISFMSCKSSHRWSLFWKTEPTTLSKPATVWSRKKLPKDNTDDPCPSPKSCATHARLKLGRSLWPMTWLCWYAGRTTTSSPCRDFLMTTAAPFSISSSPN